MTEQFFGYNKLRMVQNMRQEVTEMPKSRGESGEKNLIADKLRQLREERGFSQRKLAMEFQLMGLDIDRNVITRIETKQRYVTDLELCAIMKVFQVSSEELLSGWEEKMRFVHTPEEETDADADENENGEDRKREMSQRISLKDFPREADLRRED